MINNIDLIFAAYTQGGAFLSDLEDRRYRNSSLIVFLDYYLESGLKANSILKKVAAIDPAPVVIIFSSTVNKETSVDTRHLGGVGFISKDSYAPRICRILLEQVISRG